ncbi:MULTISPECIES: hypothetical protein [unclassified Streptomyces]|uniref:hypothetical protein n=1 Tax=unclassified Streptomyces TaxID=2593676 RepID=UPI00224DD5BC|nr:MULTISPECIES: hypothetical protein [unclassified Streptomyces]WSP53463.1 hypothetical protein OG306_02925 [Streptomyces sp. NBC_01241]WSU25868.1 hypothetical protein OG508_36445 [Streptomyces sp. NBC_01108]MCX4784841.1 hypothetical protein [Streptomyces sp. NBC_01221]MCX4799206.1 hypothetical protein [Streptomyces sp. NBC_01242]WSJ40395.1 hypothetical protein OG772_33390 [Streptomyces sp. NBC_01321]
MEADDNRSESPDARTEPTELEALRARVTALEARAPARHRLRARSFLAVLLILVAAVLTPLSIVSTWAKNQIGDTDNYVAMMAPLASDPDVQAAVSDRVTGAVMKHLDVKALLADVAPADRPVVDKALTRLSGPLTTGVTGFVHETVEKFVTSDAFATIWTDLNRAAQSAALKALTGSGNGAVKLTNDTVTIDLAPVIDRVKQRLVDRGLTIAAKIPEIHTDFTVLTSDAVGKAKKGFRALQILGFWLPPVTLVLAAGGVLLAVRRRRALVTAALAIAAGAAVLAVTMWLGRAFYLDSLPPDVSQPAAGSVFDALAGPARTLVRVVITLGIVVALAAWLTGAGRAATRVEAMWSGGIGAVRDAAGVTGGPVGSWVHRARAWLNWTVVVVAAAVLVVWDRPTGLVTVCIALCALFALAVVEFLDGDRTPRPAVPGLR